MLEISKMLTLSTKHITPETAELIEMDHESLPTCYRKGTVGYLIYVDKNYLYLDKDNIIRELLPKVPDDLYDCMLAAYGAGCRWLCLDCNGPVDDELPVYEWQKGD